MSGGASWLPSRREVLVGGGLLSLAGCLPGVDDASPPPVDPELRVRARIADEARTLARHYETVLERFPTARPDGQLAAFAADHSAHVRALLGPGATGSLDSAASSPSAATTGDAAAPVVPADPEEAVLSLVAAEQAASRRRARQAGQASPVLARLLAAVAACEATHAALLKTPGGSS